MATTVQTGGGSGVDLSELTSGELLFCSLLKIGYIRAFHYGGQSGRGFFDLGFDNEDKKSIDMSKISQISFVSSEDTSNAEVVWVGSTSVERKVLANAHFSISAPSGDNSHSTFSFYTLNDGGSCIVKVTSFTTTDGKVHTADNLNY